MVLDGDLEKYGFAIVSDVLDESTIAELLHELQQEEHQGASFTQNRMYALRNLFQRMPGIGRVAASGAVRSLVEPYLGAHCFAVRALFFDKLPGSNWKVPWHQDLSVALAPRRHVEGYGPWSHKAGVLHAQAPVSLLESMLTVRLHLDACPLTNGPLRVLPGSHRYGKLEHHQIETLRSQIKEEVCEVECGGALLMRPLLLHASSSAQSPSHRRVLHLEYANTRLPDGLEWYEEIQAPAIDA